MLLELIYGAATFASGAGTTLVVLEIRYRKGKSPSYKCQCNHEASFHTRKTKRNGDNVEITFGSCSHGMGSYQNSCGCQGYIGDVPPATPSMMTYDPYIPNEPKKDY